jgi:UDP-N-acetylglucosamine transferase subunit ALG13
MVMHVKLTFAQPVVWLEIVIRHVVMGSVLSVETVTDRHHLVVEALQYHVTMATTSLVMVAVKMAQLRNIFSVVQTPLVAGTSVRLV